MAVYTNRDRQTITTTEEVGRGGEGVVYRVAGRSDLVAKIYHPALRTYTRQAKLTAMVTQPPPDEGRALVPLHVSLAWPTDLLFNADAFAGFLMPRIERSPNLVALFNPQLRGQRYPHADRRFLLRTAQNLATVLAALHSRGHVVGDLNQKNILVKANALVTLVDTDSFQILAHNGQYYRCGVGVPDYTAPELQGQGLATSDRQPYHDCFGLSVLLFQLLMEGYHPFTGRPLTTAFSEIDQLSLHCLQQGVFPYSNNRAVAPPPAAPPFTWLPRQIRRLFLQSFLVGYRDPTQRPTAAIWAQALGQAGLNLIQCQRHPQHWYSNHLDQCPFCALQPKPAPKLAPKPLSGLSTVSQSVGSTIGRPTSMPTISTIPGFTWLPGCVINVLKILGILYLVPLVFNLLFNGYWPILLVAVIVLLRFSARRQKVVPVAVRCYHWLVTVGRQLWRSLQVSYRWLAPRAQWLGHAALVSWRRTPAFAKQLVPIVLLIGFLAAISYFGDSPNAVRQPPSPLVTAQPIPLRESPLATPTLIVRAR